MSTVNVVIATFRRPGRLRMALDSLVASAERAPHGWTVGVTVVDDDPQGSARPVADEYGDAFALGCTYVPCGQRNISHARNAGLESAVPTSDWVASIDDDETVPIDWFEVCASAIADGRYNAVTGPSLKDFANGPAWLTRQPFSELGKMPGVEGEPASVCSTGNNWVSSEFLRRHPDLRFKPDLGVTGGEDMDFFYRAVNRGLRPVYSLKAAVIEKEPEERCTFRYLVRRAFWLGISEAQISLRLGLASRSRLLARSLRRAMNGGRAQLPPEALSRRGVRYFVTVLSQCTGVIMGCLGMRMRHK